MAYEEAARRESQAASGEQIQPPVYQDMGHVTAFNAPTDGTVPVPMPRPALGNQPSQEGALSNPYAPIQSNRRDMAPMAMPSVPQGRIGMNEALIRIGGAGVRGSAQGGLESIGAMTDTYGNIQDANRKLDMGVYDKEYAAMKEQRDAESLRKYREGLIAKGSKSSATDKKNQRADAQQIATIDQTLVEMERAYNELANGGITGLIDGTVGKYIDEWMGNPEAVTRKLLNKLKVDDALLRIAQTKGAISNKEMDLFLSPAPSDTSDEKIWQAWIQDRMTALRKIKARLQGGETVDDPATASQVDSFSSSGGSSGSGDGSLNSDDQALLDKYK